MNIYLLRHALAFDRMQWHKADSDRPLTKEGIRKMKKVAKGMRHMKLSIDWILTSPYRRALDTAQIVAKEFKINKKLRIFRSLTPDGDPKTLVRHLGRDYRSWESVLLVGHEPYLSRLIAILISGRPDIAIELKKSGLCALTSDSLTYDRCAKLEWLIQPKLTKKIN